jgi:hypothetical protein
MDAPEISPLDEEHHNSAPNPNIQMVDDDDNIFSNKDTIYLQEEHELSKYDSDLKLVSTQHASKIGHKAKLILFLVVVGAIFSVIVGVTSVLAYSQVIKKTEDMQYLEDNWKLLPIVDIASTESDKECPNGYKDFFVGPSWPGLEKGCDCTKGAGG